MMIRIIGTDLPGLDCGPYHNIHVGVQRKSEPDQLVAADQDRADFAIQTQANETTDGYDLRGPHIQGRRGSRFIYLTWGELPEGGSFRMFRRAKLSINAIPNDVLAAGMKSGVLEACLGLTDIHGRPVCADVAVTWRPGQQTAD